ncbi:MAG: RagB/SusD family nutrient uptake outer membrane protein [Cyclobacteriaceae bacterium]
MRHTFLLAVLASVMLACDERLDIEPDNSITSGTALETSSDVEALLVGAYDRLGDGDLYGGNLLRDAELIASFDELFWNGTFVAPGEIYRKRMLVTNGVAENTWEEAYETINITNNVLANLDVVNEGERDRVEGEARFIRGTLYFELVRAYGPAWNDGDPASSPGVPLITTPTSSVTEESFVGRASVADIYEQVLEDLQAAATLLPETNGFFANQSAAQAMLSRVYLMQGEYADAATMADNVISSGNFRLTDTYAAAFNNESNSSEDIFAMQVTSQDGVNDMNTFFAPPSNTGRGDIFIRDAHLDLYEEGDTRRDLFYFDEDIEEVVTGKWNNQFANVNIIRLAEMYLTRAEGNFRAGTTIGATPLEDINTIRERAGLAPLDELTLDRILLERRLELAFEGHYIHDKKRNEIPVGELPYDSPRLVYPIPLRELDANPALQGQQNEGYAAS